MLMNIVFTIILIIAILIIGIGIGYIMFYKKGITIGIEQRKRDAEAVIGSAEQHAERIVKDAERYADNKRKSALIEAKDEIHRLRFEFDREIKDRRAELSNQEKYIQQKEKNLEKKANNLEKKEETINLMIKNVEEKFKESEKIKKSQLDILEKISCFTKDQAKEYILKKLEEDLIHEKAVKITAYEQQLKNECNEKARKQISLAISKIAADQISEAAVSVISLPNDEIKGRIIGREGRNIRALETLTGVDIIIDDTPEAITLSCFDQIRREVAKIAIEKLIADGHIHPTRIEETVDKARHEVEYRIEQEGEHAVIETNIHGINHDLIKLLGRLKYRTSYRQNVLDHSIEVAKIAGVFAAELGVDTTIARRAGLLHDIGKALTSEIEGSHVQIGVDLCKKYNENYVIIHAVEAHHNNIDPKTVIACIVQAADAISAARPAARSENYEKYIKRIKRLEEICSSYRGVEKCFAIQAGREVRIMILPEIVPDEEMVLIARRITKQIETEMEYPGQIKITLIREIRVVDYAK